MAITSSGTGSGLDINGIISQLMALEKQPLTKLDTKEATYQTQISAMGTVKGALSSLQSSVSGLLDLSKYDGVTAKVSNADYASMTATNTADIGAFSLDVLQLAQSQKLTSKAGVFTSATQVLATRTQLESQGLNKAQIKLTFGTVSGSGFSSNLSKAPVSIDLTPNADGNITLAMVRDAINAKTDAGVSASIITDATGSARLTLSSKETGAAMGFKLGLEDDATLGPVTDLDKLIFDPESVTAPNFEILSGNESQDAIVKLNGLQLTRSNNTISDAISGVTLTLKKSTLTTPGNFSTSTPVTMTTSRDSSSFATNLDAFVKAYNELNTQMTSLTKIEYNAATKVRTSGPLAGDAAMRSIQTELRSVFNASFSGSESVTRLSQLGVSFQKDGSIALDRTKLDKAVKADPDAIAKFMGAYDKSVSAAAVPEASKKGFAYKLNTAIDAMLLDGVNQKGTVASKIEGMNRSISDINKQRDVLNMRLEKTQARLTREYTALDVAIGNMKQTSASLTSMLATLTASTSG